MKKLITAAIAALAVTAASAGTGFVNGTLSSGDGSVGNAYDLGMLTTDPTVLDVTLFGAPNSSFEEHANFMTSGPSQVDASGNTYTLVIKNKTVREIDNLTVNVWDNVHPNGSTLYATFSGDNTTASFVLPTAGQYHLDIDGLFGPQATGGQYEIALMSSPIPEPATGAMIAAGLASLAFIGRRRRQQ